MKVIWLGQNGLLFVSGRNKILVDPYLSDSLRDLDIRMVRGWRINKKFYSIDPNVIVLTNSHLDHTDIVSLKNYIERNRIPITLLCSESVFEIINSSGIVGRYNNVMLRHGSEWTHDNLNIKSVPAMTDDKGAMGVVITDSTDGKKYYVTSDTLYNESIFASVPKDIDTLFIPINGEDGSMNVYDAMRFAKVIDAVHTVPVHYGMFDDVDPKIFKCEGRVIPDIYKVIPLMDNERTELKKLSLKKVFDAEAKEMKELNKVQRAEAAAIASCEIIQTECEEKTDTFIKNEEILQENNESSNNLEAIPLFDDVEPSKEEKNLDTCENLTKKLEEIEEKPEETAQYPDFLRYEPEVKEPDTKEEATELNDDFDVFDDDTFKTVEIDTVENELAYETLDTIVSAANESVDIIEDTEEYDNVDDDDSFEEYDDSIETGEYEVIEYEEEYVAPSFDDFEPLSPEEYIVEPSSDDFSKTGEIEIKLPEDQVEYDTPEEIEDVVEVDAYEGDTEEAAFEVTSDEEPYTIEDMAALDGADSVDVSFDDIPDFEESIDADTELIYSDDEEEKPTDYPDEVTEDSLESFSDDEEEDLSSKIDAYIKEIEKFERGDTADFSLLDFDS